MKTITANIDWKVYNLKKLFSNQTLTSRRFCNTDFNVAWELCLSSNHFGHNFTIWLRQTGPNSITGLVKTKYRIYAKKNGTSVDIARSTYKLEHQERLGYTSITLEQLSNDSDSLSLHCEIEYDCHSKTINLQNNFRKMLEKEIFTDCVIKVGDEVIKAHRCVLAQSEVFQKMFEQNGMTEALNGEVIISDFTAECVRAMLEFFYTGEVTKTILESHVVDIFAIAHKYGVEMLKYECELIMANLINTENIVKYCHIINLYDSPALEKACTDFIKINSESFFKSKEWEEMKNNCSQLAFRFMENVITDIFCNNLRFLIFWQLSVC